MKNALALGTFDGLHKGHMSVVNAAVNSGFKSIAVIFAEPPAASLLNKEHANILDLKQKIILLKKIGFEDIVVLDFNAVKDITAEQFLNSLKAEYNPKKICCGFNYTFGKAKSGGVTLLAQFCKENNIQLSVSDNVMCDGVSISSSHIRSLINEGNINKANTFLYEPFSFCAKVIHGDERGRTIGIPTINQIYPKNLVLPRFGVYSTNCKINGKNYKSITNIGYRPTYKTDIITAETHILDFNLDIYSKNVTVTLNEFLRDEIYFDNIEQLKNQISIDIKKVRGVEK